MNKSERRIWKNKIRRQEERKRHFYLFLFTFCLVIGLSMTAGVFLSHAKMKNEKETFKHYKSVAIEKGDTLWSIALQNTDADNDHMNAYIKEVKRMNGLRDDTITAGMYLVIPYHPEELQN